MMVFRKKKGRKTLKRDGADTSDYEEAARNTLRSVGTSGHTFSDDERDDVETRLRRMFHGARVEGSKAPPPADTPEADSTS